ncbi:hypothetical protein [Nonomuraea wenchangensis]|uniref:hypothetical protein n=1 Tax=Nonomuraea wenchangensis TaxID=568860 RepID=UPI0033192292
MNANLQRPRCPAYNWCTVEHLQPGTDHFAAKDLIGHLDDPALLVEVNLFAPGDGSAPPSIRIHYPGGDQPYIDVDNHVAGAIVTIIDMFEGPGRNDRRGLREFAEMLFMGASEIGEVTEL